MITKGTLSLTATACAVLALSVPVAAQTAADIEALQRQIDELQRQMEELKEQVRETPEAAAPVVRSRGDKVQLKVSGQVNRGVLFADDGENTEVLYVDNDHSSTRLAFEGRSLLDGDQQFGAKFRGSVREQLD